MSNARFQDSFLVAAQSMRALRINNPEQPRQEDFYKAIREASVQLEAMYPSTASVQPVSVEKSEEPVPPRRSRCFEHRERWHRFGDGSVMMSCEHEDCGFGKTRKTHIDGTLAGGYYVAANVKETVPTLPEIPTVETKDEVEPTPEVEELLPPKQARVAGEDEPEIEPGVEDDVEPDEESCDIIEEEEMENAYDEN